MATVNVRRLDDAVVDRLKERAAANERSLEAELREILERTAAEDDYLARKRAFLEKADMLSALTVGRTHTPAQHLLREARDQAYGRGLTT